MYNARAPHLWLFGNSMRSDESIVQISDPTTNKIPDATTIKGPFPSNSGTHNGFSDDGCSNQRLLSR
jgi:hypothetical protein